MYVKGLPYITNNNDFIHGSECILPFHVTYIKYEHALFLELIYLSTLGLLPATFSVSPNLQVNNILNRFKNIRLNT